MNDEPGVGPYPQPWPTDPKYDRQLLADGDHRNVLDKYRYWTVEAIKQNLDKHRLPLEIAIENLQHDFNIGTIVRTANAFNIQAVHIIGKRHWNRRGAMVTDAYMNIYHHATQEAFLDAVNDKSLIAIDIIEGAQNLGDFRWPDKTVLLFGGEGPGISALLLKKAQATVKIDQQGSTRSINVGVAAGIVMYDWVSRYSLKH